jgi:hypothetical protein
MWNKKVNIEIEIEEELLAAVEAKAAELNWTVDEFIENALLDILSERTEVSALADMSDDELVSKYRILTEQGIPVARLIPLGGCDAEETCGEETGSSEA